MPPIWSGSSMHFAPVTCAGFRVIEATARAFSAHALPRGAEVVERTEAGKRGTVNGAFLTFHVIFRRRAAWDTPWRTDGALLTVG
jgi:hypothetical protein